MGGWVFRTVSGVFLALLALASSAMAQQSEEAADDGLTLSGEYRLRAEGLSNRFRANSSGDTGILVQRTIVAAEYHSGDFIIGGELMDSRSLLADGQAPIGNDDVNPLDLLQGYIGYRGADVLEGGDRLALTAGRVTMNIGSRRLIARNGFRNTINNFTGLRAIWDRANGNRAELFYVLPVERRPRFPARLRDNDLVLDQERFGFSFYGARYVAGLDDKRTDLELFAYGLDEDDSAARATRDRSIWTLGGRLHRAPAPGTIDFDIQAAYQFGRSSLSLLANAPRLDHDAGLIQAVVGYNFGDGWNTRFAVRYDFASGDNDPFDGRNNRFDTLFGARGQDFGPTGIYGLLARSNISSPGINITTEPSSRLKLTGLYRPASMASDRDVLTSAGVVDQSGASGRFIGNEFIGRALWEPFGNDIQFEIGVAWLGKGRFLNTAPNAPEAGNVAYGFGQIHWHF
ncbi:MAG: alginate export family protein [Pseudomonadota bacterium]